MSAHPASTAAAAAPCATPSANAARYHATVAALFEDDVAELACRGAAHIPPATAQPLASTSEPSPASRLSAAEVDPLPVQEEAFWPADAASLPPAAASSVDFGGAPAPLPPPPVPDELDEFLQGGTMAAGARLSMSGAPTVVSGLGWLDDDDDDD
jgi:hypothetical protein